MKDWATSTFGTADKTVLLGGVLVVVFLYSMLVGMLAMRRLALGFAGLAIFAGIGLAAALTRHGATGSYAVPTIFGALAGALALRWLVGTARGATARPGGARRGAPEARTGCRRSPSSLVTTTPRWPMTRTGLTTPAGPRPLPPRTQGPTAPAMTPASAGAGQRRASRIARRIGGPAETGEGQGPCAPGRPREPAGSGLAWPTARRQFLVAAGVSVAAAGIGYVGGRSLSERKSVSLAQAAVRFPKAAEPVPPLPPG